MRLQKASKEEVYRHRRPENTVTASLTLPQIIRDIKPMVKERLLAWWAASHTTEEQRKLPANIIYYRDGVSKSQYEAVYDTELQGIRDAFTEVAAEKETWASFKLTALLCIKRHSTRFFPLDNDKDSTGNCRVGTLVDRGVTSPWFIDFYLQSHHALQGTARPAYYMVLANEMEMPELVLQNFVSLTHLSIYRTQTNT